MDEKRLKEIQERLSEIEKNAIEKRELIKSADAELLPSIEAEISSYEEEKRSLEEEKATIEQRQKDLEEVKNGAGKEIEQEKRGKDMEPMEMRSTELYKRAFFKSLLNEEMTSEERAALVTTSTSGLALPETLEKEIWNLIYESHCILNDIRLYRTGTVLEIQVHSSITSGKAGVTNEDAATTAEENVFQTVRLVGKDFTKLVEVSYAASKMTAGALEEYLKGEIAEGIGEALADEVFANLKAQTNSVNQLVKKTPTYGDLCELLGACKRVKNLTIYCSNENKYKKIVGLVDKNGQPVFRDGVALGVQVKVDSSAKTEIYALDPQRYVGNMIQDVMIESDRDLRNHKVIHSGYCRFEGKLVDDMSCAYIKES